MTSTAVGCVPRQETLSTWQAEKSKSREKGVRAQLRDRVKHLDLFLGMADYPSQVLITKEGQVRQLLLG
jgi:hypothetical protein